MKNVILNSVLVVLAVVLCYICYRSIKAPIEFKEDVNVREDKVIARLIDIREAQQEYHKTHGRNYTDDFAVLVDFIKNGRIPTVKKEGNLNDDHLKAGLTEYGVSAMKYELNTLPSVIEEKTALIEAKKAELSTPGADKKAINQEIKSLQDEIKAMKKKIEENAKVIAQHKLEAFQRDTTWTPVMEKIYANRTDFNPDSIMFIPNGNGEQFEIEVTEYDSINNKPSLLEVRAPYKHFLHDLDNQAVINFVDERIQNNRDPHLKIGSLESPNNNAGNWEN